MNKLSFYYSAMGGGKTSVLIQTAYNYEQNGKNVLLIKSIKDTKGGDCLVSRTGARKNIDIILGTRESLLSKKYIDLLLRCGCILVDEAQFLSSSQVEELWRITKELNIDVICYGLKANFKGELFSGTKRLIELSDHIKELDTIPLCSCGEKARFNARKVNGEFTLDGSEVLIDGSCNDVSYVALCGKCYLNKVLYKRKD